MLVCVCVHVVVCARGWLGCEVTVVRHAPPPQPPQGTREPAPVRPQTHLGGRDLHAVERQLSAQRGVAQAAPVLRQRQLQGGAGGDGKGGAKLLQKVKGCVCAECR